MISYRKSIKIRTPYGYNTDVQSLRAGFFGGGGNVMALAENGSYGRCRAHVTLTWLGIVYIFLYCYLSLPFLFLSFRSSFIDNPIVQAARILLAILMPRLTESATLNIFPLSIIIRLQLIYLINTAYKVIIYSNKLGD